MGRGGLTRAYSESASICLENSLYEKMIYSNLVRCILNYEEFDKIKRYCQVNNINIVNVDYLENIVLDLVFSVDLKEKHEKNMQDILNRNVNFLVLDSKYVKK